jgi:DNA polymerase-4
LTRRVKEELGLPVSVGIAANKLMAKIGSDYAKPEGIIYIKPGYEKTFLAPMKVQKIPGVGPAALEKLHSYSIYTIDDLNRLGRANLERIFGKHGTALYDASHGIGSASFGSTRARAKSISRERTYGRDTNDRAFIRATLCRLTEKAAADLRDKRLKAGTVTLKLRYSDFKTVTRSRSLSHPTDLDGIIFPVIRELLEDTYQRRTSVRLVGISLTRLEEETQEILIMEEKEEKMGRLCGSLDRIRKKYDDTTVVHARGRLSRL